MASIHAPFFKFAPDAILLSDRWGRIRGVNAQAVRLFGYAAEELVGQEIEILLPERFRRKRVHDRDGFSDISDARAMGARQELFGRRKDGGEFPLDILLSPVESEAGPMVLSMFRDITEGNCIKQILLEKNIEWENAVEARDRFPASMSHELSTPLHAILGFAGTLLKQLLGPLNSYQEKQLKTIHGSAKHLLSLINELLHLAKIEQDKAELRLEPVDCGAVVNEFASILKSLAESKLVEQNVLPPKEKFVFPTDPRALSQNAGYALEFTEKEHASIEMSQRTNSGAGAVAFNEELEARVAARTAELVATNGQLRELNQMKDEFLAIVSHDLRSPLSGIGLIAEQMTRRGDRMASEQRAELLGIIKMTVSDQINLVDDLLELASNESGRLRLELEEFRLSEVVRGCVQAASFTCVAKQLAIKTTIGDDEPWVHADRLKLTRVINNLLTNAIKFTPCGGCIHVVIARVENEICLRVTDNGIGIEPERLPQLFEKFKVDHQRGTEGEGGSGLGLGIVRQLIELHGGRIGVTSEVGRGSTFNIHLRLRHRTGNPPALFRQPRDRQKTPHSSQQ